MPNDWTDADIEIRKGIPRPPRNRTGKYPTTYALSKLNVGDVYFPASETAKQEIAGIYNHAKKLGIKVATGQYEGRAGVWRIA